LLIFWSSKSKNLTFHAAFTAVAYFTVAVTDFDPQTLKFSIKKPVLPEKPLRKPVSNLLFSSPETFKAFSSSNILSHYLPRTRWRLVYSPVTCSGLLVSSPVSP
jgi:hypothetical protein